MPKAFRIRKRSEYKSKRARFYGEGLVFEYSPASFPRLGITAPRAYGKAVQRNRFKRHIRETFRLKRAELPPVDIVVLPKKGAGLVSLEIIQCDFRLFYESQCAAAESRSHDRG